MDATLVLREELNVLWKYGSWIAGVLSLLFALIFWNLTDPLWVGILRLIAFILFSFFIFGLLKRLGGPLQLTLIHGSEYLLIEYRKKEKIIHKEKIERSAVDDIIISEDSSFISRLMDKAPPATLYIRFQDDEQSLPLFEHDGRTLFFNRSNIMEADRFLRSTMAEA